jgi:PII-like signaling protein
VTGSRSRLTVYFGERGRAGDAPAADGVMDRLAAHGVTHAVLLRAGEGFGPRHGLQTSSQLSLSEDLPLVVVAVGDDGRILDAGSEVRDLLDEGLTTVEPVAQFERETATIAAGRSPSGRITVWLRRGSRLDGRPAHEASVRLFREAGADAAIALLGIDGLSSGRRRRAGFFSANRDVPMLVSAVGSWPALGRAWAEISRLVPEAFAEASHAGAAFGDGPAGEPGSDRDVRVAVYGGGLPPGGGVGQQQLLVRRLRRAGAAGATAFQGIFGFAGEQAPHAESFLTLRRRIPVLTEFVDSEQRCAELMGQVRASAGTDAIVVAQPVDIVSRPAGRA